MVVRERRGLSGRLAALGLATLLAIVLPTSGMIAAGAQPSDGEVVFSGSASAIGMKITLKVDNAPATDTPVNGGGPSAQVAVDSVGSSTGYAAFPDPGQFAVAAPGLIVGLLASGAGGLPPIELPSPPGYPFYVRSDLNDPSKAIGAGPYRLSAESGPGSSQASAVAGFETDLVGNIALSTATASIGRARSGGIESTATSDVQALTIGPLTVGQITSTATMTMRPDGTVTPSTDLEIVGARIGGVPMSLTPDGFVFGEEKVAVPINETVSKALEAAKMRLELVKSQTFPDSVVASALRLTMPFSSGTMTLTFGGATASLTASTLDSNLAGGVDIAEGNADPFPPEEAAAVPVSIDESAAVATVDAATAVDIPLPEVTGRSGVPGERPSLEGLAGTERPGPSTNGNHPPAAVATRRLVQQPAALGRFDVDSIYLVVTGAALAASVLGQLVRFLGVRRARWTS